MLTLKQQKWARMPFRRADLTDLSYFLEIAKHLKFRRASLERGVGSSALSHALRGLEERLGVRLLNRTSDYVAHDKHDSYAFAIDAVSKPH